MRVVMELVLAQSAGSHTCSYTENQGHLAQRREGRYMSPESGTLDTCYLQ